MVYSFYSYLFLLSSLCFHHWHWTCLVSAEQTIHRALVHHFSSIEQILVNTYTHTQTCINQQANERTNERKRKSKETALKYIASHASGSSMVVMRVHAGTPCACVCVRLLNIIYCDLCHSRFVIRCGVLMLSRSVRWSCKAIFEFFQTQPISKRALTD